jgi:hypothetical protein
MSDTPANESSGIIDPRYAALLEDALASPDTTWHIATETLSEHQARVAEERATAVCRAINEWNRQKEADGGESKSGPPTLESGPPNPSGENIGSEGGDRG